MWADLVSSGHQPYWPGSARTASPGRFARPTSPKAPQSLPKVLRAPATNFIEPVTFTPHWKRRRRAGRGPRRYQEPLCLAASVSITVASRFASSSVQSSGAVTALQAEM